MSSIVRLTSVSILMTLLLLSGACRSTGADVVSKSEDELLAMEQQANQGRSLFWSGEYEEAIAIYEVLVTEKTVSQPLYQAELGCAYLLLGDREKAFQQLSNVYTSLEAFIDPTSEGTATSLWGSEAKKIYKGDPYERSMLCLLMGLMYMERDEIDNALACFKNGQLADSDVEKAEYSSDFGLLQLLEAKCYELRDQTDMADQLIELSLKSLRQNHGYAVGEDAEELQPGYWSDVLSRYNGLILVWSGHGPQMGRRGRYGEERVIFPGKQAVSVYVFETGGTRRTALRGFADLGYQAATRGGRKMDNVLGNQAAFKGVTADLGKTFMDSANTGNAYADLTLLAVGGIFSLVSSAANPAADIRCWKTLPCELQIVPLSLPVGVHEATLTGYHDYSPVGRMDLTITVPEGNVFRVEHVMIGHGFDTAIAGHLGLSNDELALFQALDSGAVTLDTDGNGEITRDEREAALAILRAPMPDPKPAENGGKE